MQTCPNCGKENALDSKFCIYCGAKLTGIADSVTEEPEEAVAAAQSAEPEKEKIVEPIPEPIQEKVQPAQPVQPDPQPQPAAEPTQPVQPNPNVEATKQFSAGYWTFFVDSLKHPFKINHGYNKYFGLVSLLLNAIFISLATIFAAKAGLGSSTQYIDQFMGEGTASSFGFMGFIDGFLTSGGMIFATASVAHLAIYFFLGDKRNSYLQNLTIFAHFVSFALLLDVVAFFFGMIGNPVMVMLCIFVGFLVYLLSFFAIIIKSPNNDGLDHFYVIMIAMVILVIVIIIWSMVIGSMFQGQVQGQFNNY